MSPRRRTLCFVFTLLLLNNNFDFVAGLSVGPVLTENCPRPGSPPQLVNSLLTATSGPGNRGLLEVPQKAFPTQHCNEVFSCGSYPPGLSINTGAPRPNCCMTTSLPIVDPITEPLPPSNVKSLPIIKNYPPVTQTIQVEGLAPPANVADIYQTPITVQNPSMPQLSPICVASPVPEILPSQNIIQGIITPNVVTEIYPATIETVISVPVEITTLNTPSSAIRCSGQMPVTFLINMASPWIPEPVQAARSPSPSFDPSFSLPPAPIIVMKKSKSKWKSILPILMLALFDGGCGNNGGGGCSCSQCSASTPIPFPIVIPTNNPVITRGRSKGKGKACTDAQS